MFLNDRICGVNTQDHESKFPSQLNTILIFIKDKTVN